MTPSAGDFEINIFNDSPHLECPVCGEWWFPDAWTIRELVAAASEHVREAHPVNVGTPV